MLPTPVSLACRCRDRAASGGSRRKTRVGSALKMSCVPLPWWTSKSTMATRSAPYLRCASRATMATVLMRQKPIGVSISAWWPGGRMAQKALSTSPSTTASSAASAAAQARSAAASSEPDGNEGVLVDLPDALGRAGVAQLLEIVARHAPVRPASGRRSGHRGAQACRSAARKRLLDGADAVGALGMALRRDVVGKIGLADEQRGQRLGCSVLRALVLTPARGHCQTAPMTVHRARSIRQIGGRRRRPAARRQARAPFPPRRSMAWAPTRPTPMRCCRSTRPRGGRASIR